MPIVQPVILSGGSGTRLWPLSRASMPKQFLTLTGVETMLQLTVGRTLDRSTFAAPMIVASERHAELIEAQLGAAGAPDGRLILEPAARNTAPAIALAALTGPEDSLLLVMPSDHAIADADAFRGAVERAIPAAQDGWLVALGIEPDKPETGYGYIERGDEIGAGVHRAKRFVEKPDAATAAGYLASGDWSWNGGIFLFGAGSYIEALRRHAPDVLDAARAAMEGASSEGARLYPDAQAFGASPDISIDYAVMEKAERVAVVPVSMGWSDIGSWDALHEFIPRDAQGNGADEGALLLDSSGCLVRSSGPVVVGVGLSDLIIVATDDAVLILPRGQSQRIKEAVDELKRRRSPLLD